MREPIAQPPHFCGECLALAPHLAERPLCKQQAQYRLTPIDQPDFHRGAIVSACGEIGFVERIVGKRAGELRRIDGKPEFLRHLAASEATARTTGNNVERDILVMVGEPLRDPVGAFDHPAAAKRGHAGVEL